MNETSQSMTRAKAASLALKIKQDIATPLLVWEKGWYKATYLDLENGYDLRLFVKSKAEGEKIAKAIVGIQNHTYNDDYFQFIDHSRSYPVNPGTHVVYESTTAKPRQRPRLNVRFTHAQLLLHGRLQPINLVALTGSRLRSVIQTV